MPESLTGSMRHITKVLNNFTEVLMFGSSVESWERRAATSLARSQQRRRITTKKRLYHVAELLTITTLFVLAVVAVLLVTLEHFA